MISVTLSQLTDILNGELQGADITLDAVTTDTRKLTPGCLFVALKGERFDAHDFADGRKLAAQAHYWLAVRWILICRS